MSTTATAKMTVKDWQEAPYGKAGDVALAQADSPASLTGDLEGESTVRTLLVYPQAAAPSFVALQTFTGSLGGRAGSFVLQQSGTFQDNAAHVSWTVVPGSGSEELAGLTGTGGYVAPSGEQAIEVTLTYELP